MKTKRKNHNIPYNNNGVNLAELVSYCPLCTVSFSPREAVVISEGDKTQLLYVNCSHCTSAIVLLLLANDMGTGSVGLITDLTENDVHHFRNGETVTVDDVIELHRLLAEDAMTVL